MAELFDHIDELRRSPGKVAVATLVNTRGTTPRKEGAKMLVGEGGAVLGSVTIGGCVDAQVIEQTEDVLNTMKPRLLELNLGDEEAWEIGLTCGGTIEVFVEPLSADFLERVRAHTGRGGRAAIVTRLDGPVGAKVLVLDDGTATGMLGDAALDATFTREARAAMTEGTSRTLFLENTRAFVEVFAPASLLLVVGASHVSMPMTELARVLGYRSVVIDGRPRFATRERFPAVDELRIGIPSELVGEYPLVPSTALVLMAHDYKYDLPVLHKALATEVGYIGMLGSARRGAAILKLLSEEGESDAALKRIRVPIGLDIGARSAPEIALAVMAEIQAVRGGGGGRGARGEGLPGGPVDTGRDPPGASQGSSRGAGRRQCHGRRLGLHALRGAARRAGRDDRQVQGHTARHPLRDAPRRREDRARRARARDRERFQAGDHRRRGAGAPRRQAACPVRGRADAEDRMVRRTPPADPLRRRLGARRGRRVDGAQAGRRGGADRGRGERARPSRSRLRWAHAAGRPHGAPRCSGSSRELALARDLGRQGRARDADLRHVFPGDDVRPGVASHSRRRARGQPDAGGAGPRRSPLARRGVPLPALPHERGEGRARVSTAP